MASANPRELAYGKRDENWRSDEDALPEQGFLSAITTQAKRHPALALGMTGFFGAVGYGIFSIKKKGSLPLSLHIIHTRLLAQGIAVGCMFGVMLKSMADRLLGTPPTEESKKYR